MSSYGPCREVRQELAIYVLGAIEPGGRDVVDRHVAGCADCRGELAALAGLPALLRRVPAGEAVALLGGEAGSSRRDDLPSGPVLRQMLARAHRDGRRRVRIRVAAAAAAGLIGGASALAGWQAAHPPAQQTTGAVAGWAGTTRAADPHSGASATVRYASPALGSSAECAGNGHSGRHEMSGKDHRHGWPGDTGGGLDHQQRPGELVPGVLSGALVRGTRLRGDVRGETPGDRPASGAGGLRTWLRWLTSMMNAEVRPYVI